MSVKLIDKIYGIYKIVNIITGDSYIGSSCNMQRRRTKHFHELRKGDHHSQYLQRAFSKYGESNFEFVVIEEFIFPDDYIKNQRSLLNEHLVCREQYYIDTLKSTYNGRRIAWTHGMESLTQEHKNNISKANKGRSITQEHRDNLAKARMKGSVVVYKGAELIGKYDTTREASEATGLSRNCISQQLRGFVKISLSGYTFKYEII